MHEIKMKETRPILELTVRLVGGEVRGGVSREPFLPNAQAMDAPTMPPPEMTMSALSGL